MKQTRLQAPTIVLAVIVLVVGVSGGAMAAKMITGKDIKNGSLTTKDLHNGAVTTKKLKNGAVGTNKLKSGAVGTSKLKNGAVGTDQLKNGAVTTGKIKDGTIGTNDLSSALRQQASRTVYVTAFGGVVTPNAADTSGLKLTDEGAQFGPFADAGQCSTPGQDFARLNFTALNGKTLADVGQLDFTGVTQSDNNTSGVGSLDMRITTDGPGGGVDGNVGFSRYSFSPNTQPGPDQNADTRGQVKTYVTTLGTWRENDDGDANPAGEMPFSHWQSVNGGEHITKIDIILGCEAGINLEGIVRSIQANGTNYVLGTVG